MKRIKLEFSKYESVTSLWSELIEQYGFERAKKLVSQAIDLQKMNGNKNLTIPIVFSGTGGLALIPIKTLKKDSVKIDSNEKQVLIFNPKKRLFQILNET
tara:strand:- start:122 stop:421 length:300 start_codon:yes stop_codon:yes gene_type:complete